MGSLLISRVTDSISRRSSAFECESGIWPPYSGTNIANIMPRKLYESTCLNYRVLYTLEYLFSRVLLIQQEPHNVFIHVMIFVSALVKLAKRALYFETQLLVKPNPPGVIRLDPRFHALHSFSPKFRNGIFHHFPRDPAAMQIRPDSQGFEIGDVGRPR